MKKFTTLLLPLLALILTSCGGSNPVVESNIFEPTTNSGALGSFSLLSPYYDELIESVPTFTWESSENAEYYTLEIASTLTFINNDPSVVYYKQDYITSPYFTIKASLTQRDMDYYWRVKARSGGKTQECDEIFTFHLSSIDYESVDFSLGRESDWSIHSQGTQCDLDIDKTNFFNNNKDSLVINFVKENNIGWVVVTKTVELDTYGTDAMFLRFFYSGDDATASLRLIDNNGGFWRHKIQLANNCKQIVLLPFDEFTHDTAGVTYGSENFNHYHIKYMEIVFDRSWGDGACLVSEIKAVKKSNFASYYIDDLNFNDYPTEKWSFENGYNFGYDIASDGKSYTLHYDAFPNELNTLGMNKKGYAFTRIPTDKFFSEGDTIKFDVKYSGSSSGNFNIRIKEEDSDLWYYAQPLSSISSSQFTTIYIPFKAFVANSLNGNGKREMSYISALQFGVTSMYGTGTITYSNFSIISKDEEESIDTSTRTINADGIIEDFENYTTPAMPFYQWQMSVENKDEFVGLDKLKKLGTGNTQCGVLNYKSDMTPATYYLPISVEKEDANAISVWLKDGSVLSDNASLTYLKSVGANCQVAIRLVTGEIYVYDIEELSKTWTEYTIPYDAFTPTAETNYGNPIQNGNITHVGFMLSYIYYNKSGSLVPVYTMNNPVYMDNYKMVNVSYSDPQIVAKEKAITVDIDNPAHATFDDAEKYETNDDVLGIWGYGNSLATNNIELGNDVSSVGGAHSLKMNYQGSNSVSYLLPITMDMNIADSFLAKGLTVDIKGDGQATVFINLYLMIGSSSYQVRKNLSKVTDSWNRYEIGFENFVDYTAPNGSTVTGRNVVYLNKVTFGIVNSTGDSSAIYVDNIRLSNGFNRSHLLISPLEAI